MLVVTTVFRSLFIQSTTKRVDRMVDVSMHNPQHSRPLMSLDTLASAASHYLIPSRCENFRKWDFFCWKTFRKWEFSTAETLKIGIFLLEHFQKMGFFFRDNFRKWSLTSYLDTFFLPILFLIINHMFFQTVKVCLFLKIRFSTFSKSLRLFFSPYSSISLTHFKFHLWPGLSNGFFSVTGAVGIRKKGKKKPVAYARLPTDGTKALYKHLPS